MTFGRAQSSVAVFSLRARTHAQLLAVLVSGLLAFLMLELLPCGGAACVGVTFQSGTAQPASMLVRAPIAPVSDLPVSPPIHQPDCALHHAHCSALLMPALIFGAVFTLVAILRVGPLLTFPTWSVAPPLPPP